MENQFKLALFVAIIGAIATIIAPCIPTLLHEIRPSDEGPAMVTDSNEPPSLKALNPNLPSPQKPDTPILWHAVAEDPDGDPISYKFLLRGSSGETNPLTGWKDDNEWIWNTEEYGVGRYVISVLIRDGNDEEGALDFDDSIECPYTLEESRPEIHAQPPPSNSPPTILDFWPDEGSPQVAGTVVRWNVQTEDPDSDQVDIKFKLKDASTGEVLLATGWGPQSTWSWDTSGWEPADYMIEVQARDGNHASADDYDDISDQEYSIL